MICHKRLPSERTFARFPVRNPATANALSPIFPRRNPATANALSPAFPRHKPDRRERKRMRLAAAQRADRQAAAPKEITATLLAEDSGDRCADWF